MIVQRQGTMNVAATPGPGENAASSPAQPPGQQPPSVTTTALPVASEPKELLSSRVTPDNAAPSCVPGWNQSLNSVTCPSSTQAATTASVVQTTDAGSAPTFMTSQLPPSNSTMGGIPAASARPLPAQKGLSGGAVAGVAIGMLLVGLLIAGAVFFFLLRRQKKKKRYDSVQAYPPLHSLHNDAAVMSEKGPTVVTSAYATNIDDMLPQPVADDTITDSILKIRDNIKNHVRTYYHVTPVPEASINQVNMAELAIATGTSPATLASMLSNTATRAETLRLIVAWIVLSRLTGESNESLLPGELAKIAAAIPGRDGKNTGQSAMYSKWKTITGALLHERIGQNAQDPDLKQRFASATADLDSIVAPFVQSSLEAQRSKNLDMILTRAANLAFLLFSQPGAFHFEFSSEHGDLVVFPSLVQTIGDQGQVLGPSRVLLAKEIAA